MRILVVEDDEQIAEAIAETLRDEAYAVDVAGRGETADELMTINRYDLAVLDWNVPAPSGIELLRRWRRAGLDLPVLMLTGRTGIEDRVGGLDTGADDYLTKPFAFDELLARVRSLLRRATVRPELVDLEAGDLVVRRAQREVLVAGAPVELSPKEFAVLEYLLQHRDEVVTRSDLSEHVWDETFDSLSNVVDVTVHRLRRKIDGDREKRLLHTVKGAGYVLKSERE